AVFSNKQPAVDVMIDNNLKAIIQNNRNKIRPIIETIILCGRQGIATRGHRDSGTIDLTAEPTQNEGNFRAKNATYLSSKTQNEIIQICGKIIQSKIVNNKNKCQCFSVLADETTDVAGIEQLSLSVRYFVTEKKQIMEEFLTLTPVHDAAGIGLADKILQTLESLSLNLSYLKGQGYDGAASMSGKFNGAQAHIFKKFPLSPYIHCSSHSLNLTISFACNVKAIRNTMGTIQEVCNFFRTPKRQHTLTESMKLKLPEEKATRLKTLCSTRWVERHDSVILFIELFSAVIDALEKINTENIDLVQALQFASCVESTINSYRYNAIEEFSKEFLKTNNWCKELKLNISFCRLTVVIPFLDSFLTQLHDRFLKHKNLLKNFSCLLPEKLSSSILNDGEDEIINLVKAYMVDIETTELGAIGELKLWRKYCTNLKSKNAIDTYLQCDENVFSTVHKLLKYFITLPVTTASGERSFSSLKRLKTYLRNTTSENRLNGLALLNIHQVIKVTPDS
ncbi:52 kDa repressor of the inhibitor of the protein kinase-like, partial [Myzus persicae]|uniref:52 kDa repressor of the inhibitor of the protein kinase-like n=1 Tax=Myzus persicae TaxID=13164 RepID=UPI000B935C58